MNNNNANNNQETIEIDTDLLKAKMGELIKAAGGTKAFIEKSDFHKTLTKALYEMLLDTEMEGHLGYEKHSVKGIGTGNSRNGKGSKTIRGDFGEVDIATPRDRAGSFEPQIIKKRQSSVGNFSDKIISLYARGMSTREIEDHLREMYEIEVSPQFISRATEKLQEDIITWQNRPLERLYPLSMLTVCEFLSKPKITKELCSRNAYTPFLASLAMVNKKFLVFGLLKLRVPDFG